MCFAVAEAAWDDLVLSLHEFYANEDVALNPQLRLLFFTPAWRRQTACAIDSITSFFLTRTIREVHPESLAGPSSRASSPPPQQQQQQQQHQRFAICSRLISNKLSAAETAAATLACDVCCLLA
jgi:hypothetical protein